MSKKNIFLILGVVIIACILIIVSQTTLLGKAPNGLVRIYISGQLHSQEELLMERDVTISQPDGKTNILHLMENGFYMKESTCITQQCIQQGQVTVDNYDKRALGTRIICAHNEVQVELVLTDRTPSPDLPDI